mgnify:CR=1 FL=1
MNKRIGRGFVILLLLSTGASAQGLRGATSFGFKAGGTHYEGDDFKAPLPRPYGTFFFEHFLSSRFSIEPSFNTGEVAARTGDRRFLTRLYGVGLTMRFAIIGPEIFRPYLAAGGRYFTYDIKRNDNNVNFDPNLDVSKNFVTAPVGGGISIRFSSVVSFDGRAYYHFAFNDLYDATEVFPKDDHFFTASAGLTFTFRKKRDIDGDGLFTKDEKRYGTNPKLADTDDDGLNDGEEVLIHKTNPLLADSDRDELLDGEEIQKYRTDPKKADSDGDKIKDGLEVNRSKTDPMSADTDSDGLDDLEELRQRTYPTKADSDEDGLNDGDEIKIHKTHPRKADTDNDGLNDADEINRYKTNPLERDSDKDGLKDGEEVNQHKTDPLKNDTDGGSIDDGTEVLRGSNPLLADDDVPVLDIKENKRIILDGVTFRTGSAEIDPSSARILDQAYYTLVQNPEVRVAIHGYTDNTGSLQLNMRLSQDRADAVKFFLAERGIEPSRIRSEGFGPRNPVAPNSTREGRRRNRRIEFVVVDQN